MTDRTPRYREIANALRDELAHGDYPVGSVFPRELDLCERFNVSRFTVRSALKDLEDAGLVERHKARGTIVKNLVPKRSFVQSVSSLDELLQYPSDTRLAAVTIENIVAGSSLAAHFECNIGAPLVKIGALRQTADKTQKLCWVDLYVVPEHAGVVEFIGRDSKPVFQIIEDEFDARVSDVDVDLTAAAVPAKLAPYLDVDANSPAVEIVRRYRERQGRIFEVSISLHPQGRFTYSMSLQRHEQGAQLRPGAKPE